jgi:hypothetical protein
MAMNNNGKETWYYPQQRNKSQYVAVSQIQKVLEILPSLTSELN